MFVSIFSCLLSLLSILVMGRVFLSSITKREYSGGIAFFVGLCLLGAISNLLLLANAFDRPYLLIIAGAMWLIFGWLNRDVLYSIPDQVRMFFSRITKNPSERVLIACLFVVVMVFIALNLVPLTATDGFGYHVPFMRDFILSHHINQPMAGITSFGLGYFPGLSEVMFSAVTLLSGLSSIAPAIIALQSGILIALIWALYREAEFLAPRPSARIIPLLILFAAPDFRDGILWAGTIDLLVFSVISVGVLLILRGLYEHERIDMYLGAILLGSSLAMKYHAIIAVAYCAITIIGIIILYPKVREWLWRPAIFVALIGAIIPSYWYIKNTLLFHNPVYPLFSGFGPEAAIQAHIYLPSALWVKFLYPVIVYMPFLFKSGGAYLASAESALAVIGICGSLILFLRTHKISFPISSLLGFILFYSWTLSYFTDERRYNLPALIIFAVLDAALLQQLFAAVRPKIVTAISYSTALCFLILLPFMMHSYGERLNVLRGTESPDAYIISKTDGHSVAAYAAIMNIR
ncbi:MAG: hypothetical protein ACHQU0_01140 [Candidatus Paceibacteria bacterium]